MREILGAGLRTQVRCAASFRVAASREAVESSGPCRDLGERVAPGLPSEGGQNPVFRCEAVWHDERRRKRGWRGIVGKVRERGRRGLGKEESQGRGREGSKSSAGPRGDAGWGREPPSRECGGTAPERGARPRQLGGEALRVPGGSLRGRFSRRGQKKPHWTGPDFRFSRAAQKNPQPSRRGRRGPETWCC
jgi:hypothetical protein